MIQLYKKENTDYDNNGDHVLQAESCELVRALNGSWEMTLEAPIDDDGVFKNITVEAVIKAPTPEGDKLFYIYDTEKISEKYIEASARPVFLNAADDAFLQDIRPTNKNGQEALDIMTNGTRYSASSDIQKVSTAYYIRKNLVEAISSDTENSFLNRWGGEIIYDNFKIIINGRVGGDHGVKILYGKNLSAIKEKTNIEETVTRIVPVAYNGYTLDGDTPWVDSPIIDSYAHVKTRIIQYDDVKLTEDASESENGFGTLELLRAELVRRANLEFENGIDKPKVTLEVDMIDLEKVAGYEDYAVLEKVSLGDTVYCEHSKLGITTTARVIKQKWDCILERNSELTIGDFQYSYFSKINTVVNSMIKNLNPDGMLMAEKVSGILNGIQTQIKLQSTVAKKVEGRAFTIEDLDPDSDLYGAMIFGTQGLQIAVKRTQDGRDWDWTTAVTARGIVADAIITGLLADKTGKNYWNMDTGEFSLSAGTTIGGTTVYDIIQAELNTYSSAVLTPQLSALQTKINEKIETWYQDTDPSVNWTGTETVPWIDHNGDLILAHDGNPIMVLFESEKYEHEGDLWQNTTDGTEWIYLNGRWNRKEVPDEVFDKIDGKAQVFKDQPTPPYNIGDLWFAGQNADIMTCIVKRESGSFVSSDWEKRNRYTDDGALNNFISEVFNPTIVEMQKQLDGQLEQYFYDYEPALDNYPASEWNTEEARAAHEGDLFLWKSKGYSYRFLKNTTGAWEWSMIQDTDITQALAMAAEAKDTADGKRRVFVNQPAPPYDVGDLWVGDDGSDLMRCQVSRASGNYVAGDWIKAVKYTDDSYAETVQKNLEAVEKDLQEQVDGKIESYNQSADPSGSWTTETLKTQHKGDLWYNPDKKITKRWNGSGWAEIDSAQAEAAEALAKEKKRVFNSQPAPPYDAGDLWVQGLSGDIMRCIHAKASGSSYAASDWERASKYTDDSALTAFIQVTFAETLEEVQNSLDQKVQTHYQETDPSVSWTGMETVPLPDTNGDPILDHAGAGISVIWEKEKYVHEGDLWKKTTDNTEWIYKSGKWMPMEVPDEVFDKIDGKAQVFMATPYTPYADGDIWITSTEDGKASIKICTTARSSGTYVATDWIDPKYIDSEGVKTQIDNYDTALDQLKVYEKLTGGSTEQGIIIRDGRLYVNATYIVAGMLAGKYIDAKGITVKDKNGSITLGIDTDGNVTIKAKTFSLDGKTVDAIAEEKAYAAENNAKKYTKEQIAALPEQSGNLVKGYRLSESDISDYWDTAGAITYNQIDPAGGTEALRIYSSSPADTSVEAYVSANRSRNTVISNTGRYVVSVWLKGNRAFTTKISFNRVVYNCAVTISWKKFTFIVDVDSIAPSYQLFTIGGFGGLTGSNALFVYNPDVRFGYTNEDIFNLLTNNGETQGIYMVNNKVYVNGAYIKALSIAAEAIKAGAVTADKISVDDLYAIGATIGGYKISQTQIFTDPGSNNISSIVLSSSGAGAYIRIRHKENGSYVNDFTMDATNGIYSGASKNALQLIKRPVLNSDTFSDGAHHSMGSTQFNGPVQVNDDFKVSSGSTKSVQRDTKDYGIQDFYCFETPTPSLGDFGESVIAEDGVCIVDIDDVFRESVNTEIKYYVFLQKEGEGDCWISRKTDTYFTVRGTPGLRFAYEIKAKQRNLEHIRFTDESRSGNIGFMEPDYEAILEEERETTIKEMEETS